MTTTAHQCYRRRSERRRYVCLFLLTLFPEEHAESSQWDAAEKVSWPTSSSGGGPPPPIHSRRGRGVDEIRGNDVEPPRNEFSENDRFQQWSDQEYRQQRPPPPPYQQQQPAQKSSSYNPIHYEFQSISTQTEAAGGVDDVPRTFYEPDRRYSERLGDQQDLPQSASPRSDVVTRYMASSKGKALLRLSSMTVGASLGAFLGKSLLNRPLAFAIAFTALFFVCTFLRNPYGELVRALGMTLIFNIQRSRRIRRQYPTFRHIKSSLGAVPRQPFPNSDNPWAYQPANEQDVDFNMLYSVVAMGFVGSACGGNLPLIPTWIGALTGAACFAFLATVRNAHGDLARAMGMRVVKLVEEVFVVNRELELLQKLGVVSSKILDKMLILDRKHRIKDRIIAGATFLYDQVARTASQVQSDMQDKPAGEDPRRSTVSTSRQDFRGEESYATREPDQWDVRRNERPERSGTKREDSDHRGDRYRGF